MQPFTMAMMALFAALLCLRYRSRQRKAARSTRQQQLRTVKFLLAALAAWLAVHDSLQHTLAKMDGAGQKPSFVERAVSFWSK